MAEEKKKPGIVRRIFKWIGLGLLALLIILGLIFQAPWKVIALLLIILAACTQLPRPARKWFWLSAAAVVIALIIWVFLPDDNEGWRPYTFDEEFAALKAKYAIPDSENAAIIYNQLLNKYDANTFEPNFMDDDLDDLTRREPWLSKDHPELAKWLQGHQDTIAALMQACRKDKCCFPIASNQADINQTMKRLSPMRRWAFLLVRAANNDLGEDRIDQAMEKQIALLQMGNHLYQQPTNLDMLTGIAIEALVLRQFNRFVVTGNAKEVHLRVIESALGEIKHDWASDWPKIFKCEKLMIKNTLCGMMYEVNPEGKTRLSRDPFAAMRVEFPEIIAPLTYWQRKLCKTGAILAWFFWPTTPQKASEIIDASYEKFYSMAEPDFDLQKEPREFAVTSFRLNFPHLVKCLTAISAGPLPGIRHIYLRVTADNKGSQLIIALRRYKNKNSYWPEKLQDIESPVPAEILVDPFNNGSFAYKLTDDSFKLYSKGKNNIDENGQRTGRKFDLKTKQFVGKEKDDWLIWPPKTRKTKEKKTDAEQQ